MIAEELKIIIEAEVNKAVSELKKFNKVQGDTVKSTQGISFSQIKAAAATAGLGIALRQTYKVLQSWGKAASDAEEITSKYNTVFKDMGERASEAASSLSKNYGLAETSAKELLSSTGDLLTGFDFSKDAALDLSMQVNELAVDLASFTNFAGGAEGASMALTKALLGETESVKSLGIVINQNTARYKELVSFYMTTKGVTEQQAKAYTALTIATEQSKNAIGDYARTAESTANTARRFAEAQKALSEELGVVVAKRATPIIRFLADYATQAAEIVGQLNALQKITDEGLGGQEISTLEKGLAAAEREFAKLNERAKSNSKLVQDMGGVSRQEIALAQNKIAQIKIQIMEEKYLAEARANYAKANTEREKKAADDAKRKAEAAIKAAQEEEDRITRLQELKEEQANKLKELDISSAQQVAEAQINALTAAADHENALIETQRQARITAAEEQQRLAEDLINTYGFLAESIGMALVDSAEGWDYFKEQGKNAIIAVLKGFAKQWAAQAVAYYARLDFARGSAMAGAAGGAMVAAGAVKAYAQGGSFVTSGEEYIKVGDNASGREEVNITPLGTNDSSGLTHIQVYLSEAVIIDAMTKASRDGRLIISQRGIR